MMAGRGVAAQNRECAPMQVAIALVSVAHL